MTVYTCGRCGVLCERDARRCGECGRVAPALFGWRPVLDRVFPRDTVWSKNLALVLVVVFLALTIVAKRQGTLSGSGFGGLAAGTFTLLQFGFVFPEGMLTPIRYSNFHETFSVHHQWWRLVTANFLHIGVVHLLFNTVGLLQAGPFLERLYGPARMWIVFVLSGVAGYVASLLFSDAPTAGASASLCGLIGAILAYGKRRGGTHGEAIRNFAIQWILYILIFGFMVPRVNNLAHIGGAIGGFATAWFFDVRQLERRGRESDAARLGALVALLAVLVCVGFAVRFGVEFQGVMDSGLRAAEDGPR